jgi:hypothetical protein
VPWRVWPEVVLEALLCRILDDQVAGAAAHRAAKGRLSSIATVEPGAAPTSGAGEATRRCGGPFSGEKVGYSET